jgi:hypothetical protein
MTEKKEVETKPQRRMLFNGSGMAYILPPAEEGGDRRFFKTGTAILPVSDKEEKQLLDYRGVVYADTIMPKNNDAAELAKARAKVKELSEENKRLQGSLAAGVAPKK